MWPRVAALALHGLCYLLVTVGTVMAPANQAERELRRKTAKTWGKPISNLVVTSQHLTVCSLGALVLYLSLVCRDSQSEAAGALVAVLMPMQTVVGVLYWGLVLWDPWLLFPRGRSHQRTRSRKLSFGASHASPSSTTLSWPSSGP